jgi:hypothetical protein
MAFIFMVFLLFFGRLWANRKRSSLGLIDCRAVASGGADTARDGHLGDDGGDVISRDRLKQARCKPNDASIRTRIGDAAEEFQELRRTDDRGGVPDASISFSCMTLAR